MFVESRTSNGVRNAQALFRSMSEDEKEKKKDNSLYGAIIPTI